jgi:hypothetical protein
LGVKRIELVFRGRPVAQPQLYWDIVKPARREAAIEMAQSRNNHADDRDLDIGTRLIKDQEIKSLSLCEIHACHHLLALVETAKIRVAV